MGAVTAIPGTLTRRSLLNSQGQEWPVLTKRWTKLPRIKPIHEAYFRCPRRFIVVPAGRRSYKTEIAKRKLVLRALGAKHQDAWYVAAAPVHHQAKRIFWQDLKRLVPPEAVRDVSEGELTIWLENDATITVLGLDAPDRIEGPILDGIVMDEYGKMKESVWSENVQAALSNLGREGWAIFVGVPEGRNHYYDLYCDARASTTGEWAAFWWKSSEVLDPNELELRRATMDPRTYRQEYEAAFEDFAGRAYYPFEEAIHAAEVQEYDEEQDLVFCFDFNWHPATAAVLQEARDRECTRVIDEVFLERSHLQNVLEVLINRWKPILDAEKEAGKPNKYIYLYGDATGKAHRAGQIHPDWEIVKRTLRDAFPGRIRMRVPDANPRERERVNSVNCRLQAIDGTVRMAISKHCKRVIRDFAGTQTHSDGSGDILKEQGSLLTHLSDGIGYYVWRKFPLGGHVGIWQGM
jgi:hypothetical protein